MNTIFNRLTGQQRKPKRQRVWYYQFKGQRAEQLYKEGKYWFWNEKKLFGGARRGDTSLKGAKGDLIYSGAKVWYELEDNFRIIKTININH